MWQNGGGGRAETILRNIMNLLNWQGCLQEFFSGVDQGVGHD